jgi:hypothetical protein
MRCDRDCDCDCANIVPDPDTDSFIVRWFYCDLQHIVDNMFACHLCWDIDSSGESSSLRGRLYYDEQYPKEGKRTQGGS